MKERILGIDIGGTKTAVIVGDEDLNIISRSEFHTNPNKSFENFLNRLIAEIRSLVGKDLPQRAGISVGGPLDVEKGILFNPPHLRWGVVNLKKSLNQHFNFSVVIEHDAKACALAESLHGAGRGFNNIIFLTLGTGLGAGIIIQRRIYRGFKNLSGEVGHIKIAETGPILYGKAGSWESFCSGSGISLYAKYRFPESFNFDISTEEISRLALEGHVKSNILLKESGHYFGKGLAILLDILDPDRIILGNLAWRLPPIWLESALKTASKESLIGEKVKNRIVLNELKEQIGDYAALMVALNKPEV